jgi:NADH:ubiquinone reductase (H+-translocating)
VFDVGNPIKDAKCVYVSNQDQKDVPLCYDLLVIATGVTHSYFGHDEFAEFAPGLKGLADALRIRNKVLQAFEQAEQNKIPAGTRIF